MIYMLQLEGVLEELIRANMLCGYFGLCIQSYNIYICIMREGGYVKIRRASSVPLYFS
jgi:hypothetical protein